MFLAHSIRLRDPWQCEPTPEGSVQWSRVFHCPTGLEPDDDLWLVISGLPLEAKVSVNGHEVGTRNKHPSLTLPIKGTGPEDSSVESQITPDVFRADLTPILSDSNRIEITLPPTAHCPLPTAAFPYDARLAIIGRS